MLTDFLMFFYIIFILLHILHLYTTKSTCTCLSFTSLCCSLFLVRMMYVQSLALQANFLWTRLKTSRRACMSMICDITNILEANPSLISNLMKCDKQVYNFQHAQNENGCYGERGDIKFWAVKLRPSILVSLYKIFSKLKNFLMGKNKVDVLLKVVCGKTILDRLLLKF